MSSKKTPKQSDGPAQTKPATLKLFKTLAFEAYEVLKREMDIDIKRNIAHVVEDCLNVAKQQFIEQTKQAPWGGLYIKVRKSLRRKINREHRENLHPNKKQASVSHRSKKRKKEEPPLAVHMKDQYQLITREDTPAQPKEIQSFFDDFWRKFPKS